MFEATVAALVAASSGFLIACAAITALSIERADVPTGPSAVAATESWLRIILVKIFLKPNSMWLPGAGISSPQYFL